MSGTRRKLTPEESHEYRADAGTRRKLSAEESAGATGEPGNPGHDLYADGPNANQPTEEITPTGSPVDAVKTWADKAALGAGPQIEGLLAAALQQPMNAETMAGALRKGQSVPQNLPSSLDAYRDVRNEGEREHAASGRTLWGKIGGDIGTVSTPVPVKALPKGAGVGAHMAQGAKVGGGLGFAAGLVNSPGDLTTLDSETWKRAIKNALVSGGVGAGGGAATGAFLGGVEKPLRETAEEQALKAAGLRGGISNQVRKKLGIDDMREARELGRKFLDEDLIPFAGSKESVQKRAESLQGQAGNAIGGILNEAEMSGSKFDYPALGEAARAPILDPAKTTAVARAKSGKALELADLLEAQGADTPGSFIGANRAKSDAWKSANFDVDADIAPELYRQSVSGARKEIERQVGAALGAEKAGDLAEANRRWGIAADALKLSKNAGTRDIANSSLGLREQLVLAAGLGGGAGAAVGHGPEGLATGIASALAMNWGRKHGNAASARFADFLANRAQNNSGGVVGQSAARNLYEELLGEDDKP